MRDEDKTKEQLINELVSLRHRITEFGKDSEITWIFGHPLQGNTGTLFDKTESKAEESLQKQVRLQEQLSFANALNRIAETSIVNEDTPTILETMAEIVGETIGVDRCLICDMDFNRHLVIGLCEWLNPETADITATKDMYNRDIFINGTDFMMKYRKWLQSHADDMNPILISDGSAEVIHKQMHIKSCLWYPFSFREQGYFCLVFNQVSHRRVWHDEELRFIITVANLVEIAIQKISLLYERKQAERTLQDQYHFLQRLIDTIPNPIFYKDIKGLFQGCNAAYEAYIGLTKEEILGKSAYEVHPGDLADIYHEKDLALFREPGVQLHETSFRIADGTRRDIVFNKATYSNSDGTLAGLVGVIVDIADRKQAEEAIKAERRRLFSLLDGLPAIVYLQAPDYSIRFSNLYFWEHFGKPGRRRCYEILHGREEPCKECLTFRIFNAKSPQEWEWTRFDGRTYQIYTYPFSDIDGSPLVLVLGIDITDRKRTEKALQESESRLSRISDNMLDIISQTDTEGIIQYVSPSHKSILGHEPKDLLGRAAFDFIHPDDMNKVITDFQTAISSFSPVKMEYRFRHKDGQYLWLESISNLLFDDNDLIIGAIFGNRDITERKLAEEKLRIAHQRLQDIIEFLPDATFVVDHDKKVIAWNRAIEEMTGVRKENILVKVIMLMPCPFTEDLDR